MKLTLFSTRPRKENDIENFKQNNEAAAIFGCVGLFLFEIHWTNHRGIPISFSCVWLEDVEKMSLKILSIFGVSTGFIPTHVILEKMLLHTKELPSKNRNSTSNIFEAIKMTLVLAGFFSAAFSSSMFLTKKPFTCFLKAIMRASPTKAKYSWQEINNSNQLIISFLLRWHRFVFWESNFDEWNVWKKGLFSGKVEFLSASN